MHVPSVDADPDEAPRLAAFLDHVRTVISVHGYYRPLERPQSVLVGGANRALVTTLAAELRDVLPDLPASSTTSTRSRRTCAASIPATR